jgi:hypothetical protein
LKGYSLILENFVGFALEGCHESNFGNKAVWWRLQFFGFARLSSKYCLNTGIECTQEQSINLSNLENKGFRQ